MNEELTARYKAALAALHGEEMAEQVVITPRDADCELTMPVETQAGWQSRTWHLSWAELAQRVKALEGLVSEEGGVRPWVRRLAARDAQITREELERMGLNRQELSAVRDRLSLRAALAVSEPDVLVAKIEILAAALAQAYDALQTRQRCALCGGRGGRELGGGQTQLCACSQMAEIALQDLASLIEEVGAVIEEAIGAQATEEKADEVRARLG